MRTNHCKYWKAKIMEMWGRSRCKRNTLLGSDGSVRAAITSLLSKSRTESICFSLKKCYIKGVWSFIEFYPEFSHLAHR